jgi:paraquat-inducible protein A
LILVDASGTRASTTLLGAVQALWAQHMQPVAVLVFVTAILIPALELLLMCYLLLPLYYRRAPRGFPSLLRLLECVRPWCMIEVFLIGGLVALVKLQSNALVAPGTGLWSLAVLIVLLALSAGFFDPQGLWRIYRRVR